MNKNVVLLLALILLVTLNTDIATSSCSTTRQENSWTTKASMPKAISGAKAAVVNGKIYVMAGMFNYEYDPAMDLWTAKQPMLTPRPSGFGLAACQGKIYVIGGDNESGGYLSTNEVYDPLTDTWEAKKPMPTSRAGMDANVVDDKIYVIGGITDDYRSIHTPVNEVYDPTSDSWSTKQPAPIATDIYTSAVVDNKIYIMGGRTDIGKPLSANSNQIYDTENDSWSLGAPLPIATYYAASGATSGVMAPKRVYVIGGGFENTLNTVQVYDPALDNWTAGAPMPTNRTGLAVGVVNDIIYAMGGSLGWEGGNWPFSGHPLGATNAVEQYTPLGYEKQDLTSSSPPTTASPNPELRSFTTALIVASMLSLVGAGASLLIYFKKIKKKTACER